MRKGTNPHPVRRIAPGSAALQTHLHGPKRLICSSLVPLQVGNPLAALCHHSHDLFVGSGGLACLQGSCQVGGLGHTEL